SLLVAIIAERSCGPGPDFREFHGFRSSSLMDSALSGGPDTELLDGGSRPAWVDQMFAVMSRPLARDGDAGGKPDHFAHAVQMMERKGVSAVVIDDQCGDKRHSLLPESGLHTLAPIDDVCGK